MKIFLITDIHFGDNVNYHHVGGEGYINSYGEQFKNFFPHLKEEMENCDLVVNLGDFIHDESPEKDLETFKEALSFFNTKTPTRYVVGNHDLRHLSREKWSEVVGEEKDFYSFDLGGYHHVVLDGCRTEKRGPHYISEEQLVWLEEDLSKTSLKSIVYCHFPIDNQNMDNNYYFKNAPDGSSLGNRFFVRKVFEKSEKVLAVFSGHTHFFSEQIMKDIKYCTVPSFSENDGAHQPGGEYAIVTINDKDVNIEIKKSQKSQS